MADYSEKDVKKLSEATGASMEECRMNLESENGDYEMADFVLRKNAKKR